MTKHLSLTEFKTMLINSEFTLQDMLDLFNNVFKMSREKTLTDDSHIVFGEFAINYGDMKHLSTFQILGEFKPAPQPVNKFMTLKNFSEKVLNETVTKDDVFNVVAMIKKLRKLFPMHNSTHTQWNEWILKAAKLLKIEIKDLNKEQDK